MPLRKISPTINVFNIQQFNSIQQLTYNEGNEIDFKGLKIIALLKR